MSYSQAIYNHLTFLGRYNIRRFPEKLSNEPMLKYLRVNGRLPYLKKDFFETYAEPFRIPLVTDIPSVYPIATLRSAFHRFEDTPRGPKCATSLSTYLTLSGLRQGPWSLLVDVSRNAILLDTSTPLETPTQSTLRKFGNDRWDDRYPQTIQVHSHQIADLNFIVGSVMDFIDHDKEELALCVDEEVENNPTLFMRCFLNYVNQVLHAPCTTSENEISVGKVEKVDVDIHDMGVQCEHLFECLAHNMYKVRELDDGSYVVQGIDDEITDIFLTDQKMVIEPDKPPRNMRIDMVHVVKRLEKIHPWIKGGNEEYFEELDKEDRNLDQWWKSGQIEDEGQYTFGNDVWKIQFPEAKEYLYKTVPDVDAYRDKAGAAEDMDMKANQRRG